MDYRQLECFIRVAEEESIEAAAKRLNISASPLSRRIREFERHEVGVPLFTRSKRSIRLNEAGNQFLRDVRKVLKAYADAKHRVRSMPSAQSTKLHVGYSGSPAAKFLDRAIETFEKQFSPTEIIRHPVSARQAFDGLLNRNLDVVLMVEPLRSPDKRLHFIKIIDYPIRCVVGLKSPLAARAFVPIKELRNQHVLIFCRKQWPQYYAYFRSWFQPHGFIPDFSDDYDEFEVLLPAVEKGRGVALLLSSADDCGAKVKFLPIRPVLARANVGALILSPLGPFPSSFIDIAKACALQKEFTDDRSP